jgi:tRNA-splicing ligase RtcB
MKQLGTLGGGNHFIEVCLDTDDNVWLMLHSGSRNIGNEVATRHIATAKSLHDLNTLPAADLAYFIQGTPEFKAYWHDLDWAQSYAMRNREIMMSRLLKSFDRMFGWSADTPVRMSPKDEEKRRRSGDSIDRESFGGGTADADKSVRAPFAVNCHHNYVAVEEHFGDKVFVTRKGAINAEAGRYGIIPGSMGAKSFIIKGLGNAESFNSCSTVRGERCPEPRRRRSSPAKTWKPRPAASNAERTKASLTRSPVHIKTSRKSCEPRATSSRSSPS